MNSLIISRLSRTFDRHHLAVFLAATLTAICCQPAHANALSLPVGGAAFDLDASDSTNLATSGSSVTSWTATGSLGFTLSAGSDPTLTSVTGFKMPVVQFNGINNYLENGLNSPYTGNQFTTFAVVAPPKINAEQGILDISPSGASRHEMYVFSQGLHVFRGGGGAGGDVANTNYSGGQALVFSAVWNSNGAGATTTYIDGANPTTGNTGISSLTGSVSILGAEEGVTGFFNGSIAEIVIYNSALSDSDRQSVETYLEEKWLAPEPSSWLLMALGALGCGLMARRRGVRRSFGLDRPSAAHPVLILLVIAGIALACCQPAQANALSLPVGGAAFDLDASDSTNLTTSGSSVTSWTATGSLGFTLNAVSDPTLTSVTGFKMPVVQFNGINNYLENGLNSPYSGNQFTTFVVVAPQKPSSESDILDISPSGPARHEIYTDSLGLHVFRGGGGGDVSNGSYSAGQALVFSAVWNSNGAGATTTYIDGANSTTGNTGISSLTGSVSILGAAQGTGVVAFFDGSIAEIVIYNSALSNTDRQSVETYLEEKWLSPEPSSWLLMALGALGCGVMARRRKAVR